MSRTSVRELKHATSAVLEKVRLGETLEVTRRSQVIAVLSPPPPDASETLTRPDFAARLRALWGDRLLPTTATEMLTEDRGER